MNSMKLKYPGILPIGFFTFAIATLGLSVTVVPQAQVGQVLHYGAISGAFGVVSLQLCSLHRQLQELRPHQHEPTAPNKASA